MVHDHSEKVTSKETPRANKATKAKAKAKIRNHYKAPTKDECIASALNYQFRGEWAKGDSRCYSHAMKKKWGEDCCKHMPLIKPSTTVRVVPIKRLYTYEECMANAAPYTNRTEWVKHEAAYVRSAKAQGFRDECTAHMPFKKFVHQQPKPKPKPIFEECMASAALYKIVSQWRLGAARYHREALERGWMGDCCSHMIKRKNSSS